ncbi:hypothetical protein GCM10023205_17170 [Yinghuangia aomiensis]|uniref:Peptidase inhibitor family I36 n=1 Tax=Yinghuangia aomiensis TaxID=676205 RepID=A0ABP9H3Z1_9ACTN
MRTSSIRRVTGALAGLALAAAALVAGQPAHAESGVGAGEPGRARGDALCPDGYVCLIPGGVAGAEPYLIPECASEYFSPPFVASGIRNNTDVIVWITTPDGASLWIGPHDSATLWPVTAIDSVVAQCFVPDRR